MAGQTVLELIDQRAAAHPDAGAILSTDGAILTYARLREQIHTMRAQLATAGVKRHDRVAIVMPNGVEMAVAFLAVTTMGVAAPLNPGYRPAEFAFYLGDLSPRALVVADLEHPAVGVARSRGIEIVSSEAAAGRWDAEDHLPHENDVALILHTSGTTAKPKRVPLTHANLLASAQNISQSLALSTGDRCLNVMPLFHIHGLAAGLLAPLHSGGISVCAPGFLATEVFDWLRRCRPTWYTAVPTMHQAIVARPESGQFDRSQSALRFIRSSSSALPPQVARKLEDLFGVPVIEAYGMTEAAHQICSNPLPPGRRTFGSVGLPAGPEVAIMSDAGVILARGESGEVVIRGANVTGGYDGDASANAGAFTSGWFRTGDIGYFDESGFLHLSARLKEIINRGGEKISPREVDEVLLDHPAVAEALTFAIPDARLGEEVAAVIVLREGFTATENELIAAAAQRLVEFKVPKRILIAGEIPKGPTGKPQRIGLAGRLGLGATHAPERHVEPATPTERALVEIWRTVLKLDNVSTRARFFDLGGDSILAAQIVTRVQQQVGCGLPILALFQTPTIAEMGAAIDAASTGACNLTDADPDQLEALLAEIEAMSEDEARRQVTDQG